jgi:RNA polymerase sigma-70 factor (ECF subfamily)
MDVEGLSRERALLAGLAAGDEMAFDRVFDAWRPRLYSFLSRLTGRRDVAEDLLQETFLRLVAHAPELPEGTNLAAWLFRVARNLHVDWLRSRKLDAARTAELTAVNLPPAAGPDPFDAFASGEAGRALERALAALPAPLREILLLVGLEGMAPHEAARICGLTQEAARKRLQRARDALAVSLAAHGKEVDR